MKFLPVLAMLFSLLSACSPTIKTAGPPVAEPALSPHSVYTADGLTLPMRSWLPEDGEPQAAIVAVHGFNDYSNAFEDAGKFFAAHGVALYAYDQRGFGEAPDRGLWSGEETMAHDLATVAQLVAARHPGKPLYLLGESMGGALVMVAAMRPDMPKLQGVILSAPAVWSRDSMNVFQRSALWLGTYTMPWMTLTGHGLHIVPSDNIEMLRKLGRDPLVIKETRIDTIHGLCDLMDDAATSATRLHIPALVLYGEHDEIVPADPTYRMMSHLPNNPVPQVKAVYAHGYHMLLRDLQAKVVMADITAWIKHPDQPLPSGADARAQAVLQKEQPIVEAKPHTEEAPLSAFRPGAPGGGD